MCGVAPGEDRCEFGALGVVAGRLDGRAGSQVGGADVDGDSGGDAQPPASLATGLRREVVAVAALDRRAGEDGVTEAPAGVGSDAAEGPGGRVHRREAQVVAGLLSDSGDVTVA